MTLLIISTISTSSIFLVWTVLLLSYKVEVLFLFFIFCDELKLSVGRNKYLTVLTRIVRYPYVDGVLPGSNREVSRTLMV